MKKTNTQFVVVLVGVLVLHLAAATALIKSAQTDPDSSGLSAAAPDPYYHSNPSPSDPEQSPGWGAKETPENSPNAPEPSETPEGTEAGGSPKTIPNAFAAAERARVSPDEPPLEKQPELKITEPVPVAPTRRLTVTELLTPDQPVAPENEPEVSTAPKSTATTGPKIKPLPATESNSGTRKIRSLSGN